MRDGEGVPEAGGRLPRGPSRGASHLQGVGEAVVGQELRVVGESRTGRGAGAGRGAAGGHPARANGEGGAGGCEQQQRGAQRPGLQAAGAAGARRRPRGLGVQDGVRAGGHGGRRVVAGASGLCALYPVRKPRFPGRSRRGPRRPAPPPPAELFLTFSSLDLRLSSGLSPPSGLCPAVSPSSSCVPGRRFVILSLSFPLALRAPGVC